MLHTIDVFFSELTIQSVIARVVLSAFCSGILGWERMKKRMPAGTRTYILVSLGATLISMMGLYLFDIYGSGDPARLGAQVISGIGFIGAGTIMSNSYHQVKGLTTAAGLWVSACIGLSIGAGFITGAVIVCLTILFVLIVLGSFERHYLTNSRRVRVMAVLSPEINFPEFFDRLKTLCEYKVLDLDSFAGSNKNGISLCLLLTVSDKLNRKKLISDIKKIEGLRFLEEL